MRIQLSTTKLFFLILLCACFVLPTISNASETQGTISPTAKNAWSNNIGWINFAPATGGLQITDTAVTGTAWSVNNGWINFNPAQGGVKNNPQGQLSGSAWGEQTGWIDFSGVSISTAGKLTGMATGTIIGTLTFDCGQCNVTTDWRPVGARTVVTASNNTSGGRGGSTNSALNGIISSIVNYFFPPAQTTDQNQQPANTGGESNTINVKLNLNTGQNSSTTITNKNIQTSISSSTQNKSFIFKVITWRNTAILGLAVLITWFLVRFVF